MRSERKDDLRAIQLFENKTGRTVFTMDDVAQWIEEHNVMPMPVPPTPRQLMAERLARSAGGAHRQDDNSTAPYRAYHAIRVRGDGQWGWFDADGPGATVETLRDATQPRRELALNIGVGVNADWAHFFRTHPEAEGPMPDFDLNWEIGIRLGEVDNGQADGEDRKVG